MIRHVRLPLLSALILLAAPGCLVRKETVTVREDGAAHLEVVIEGDPADLREGDPMPTVETGWQVTDATQADENGKEKVVRTATRDVPAGAAFPGSYAAAGSRPAQFGLSWSTSMNIDRREDGTYYHFRRAYRRRDWWPVEFLRQEFFETDEIKGILGKDPKTLTTEERSRLVEVLTEYGAQEIAVHLQTAAEGLAEPLPQLAWLQARASAQAVLRGSKFPERVVALVISDAKADLAPLEQEEHRLVRESLEASLRGSGVAPATIERFLARAEDAEEDWKITHDLSDEQWKVTVALPGKIVGQNADREPAPGRPPGSVEWEFPGKALFDRDLILQATSFVPR